MSVPVKDSGLPKGVEIYNSKGRAIALKIDSACKKCGGVWLHFSQDVWLNSQMLGQDGVCYAMIIVFLGRFKGGEKGIISYFNTQPGREEVMNLWTLQTKTGHGWENLYLGPCGLKERFSRMGDTDQQIAQLIQINGYYNIGMSDLTGKFKDMEQYHIAVKTTSGHGIGVITDNEKKVHLLFDPNWGIGIFPDAASLSNFFLRYWKFEYSDLMGSTLLSRYS